jgi:hypothetical protein
MRLYQYWDTPAPPAEVADWIDSFRGGNPGFRHRLFDREAASRFIGRRVGEREQRAFDAIAVPAMQADYFRLCAVWARGGVYVDADCRCIAPLEKLLRRAPRTLMPFADGHILNGVVMCRQPGDAFLRACLDLATLNIEARSLHSAYAAAGPGVLNAVRVLIDPESFDEVARYFDNIINSAWGFPELMERARRSIVVTAELESAFRAITLVRLKGMHKWIRWEAPAYKQTERHWLNWRGSLYFDASPDAAAVS